MDSSFSTWVFKLVIIEIRVKFSLMALFTKVSYVFRHIQHRYFRCASSFILELFFSIYSISISWMPKSLPQSNIRRDSKHFHDFVYLFRDWFEFKPFPRFITLCLLRRDCGSISHFLCYKMNEPKKLEFLNLGKNLLSRKIPNC